ncbi:hypothetical protein FXO38_35594 [Capsicum annuum]|nr:hypothetical protein FXO38_35594 [Capsicum annuum]KAF3639678.1 hypothetical protein FXO37_23860 [Capsicum annuum]
MKYSEMKIAAKAYFNRNWNREDMLNPNEIPGHAHKTLKKWIWEAGGLYTVLSTVASLLWLYLTLPWSVKAFRASPALLSASWQVQQFAMELFGLEPAHVEDQKLRYLRSLNHRHQKLQLVQRIFQIVTYANHLYASMVLASYPLLSDLVPEV